MKTNNIIQDKSFAYAVRIVKLCKLLKEERREFDMSKQLMRSGTSIGANIEEALGGQSNRDFIAKLSIAYKESRESRFWLRLLFELNYINELEARSIIADTEELCKILSAILTTSKAIKNRKIEPIN